MSMDDKLQVANQRPDSQFLPGTSLQYAWDSVSLTSILSCPRRYYYSIIQGYVSDNPNFAIALVFGIQFHKGLELYHKERALGLDHEPAVHSAMLKLLQDPATNSLPREEDIAEMKKDEAEDDESDGITYRNSKVRTVYYLMRALVWYLEQYRDDPAQTVILSSGAPAVELSFRTPLPVTVAGQPTLLCGHIDRLVRFNDRNYVMDFKTSKSLTRQFFDAFQLSHQISGYVLAGQTVIADPVKGAIIDGIALQVYGTKFGRQVLNKTEGQTKEYLASVQYACDTAERCHGNEAQEANYPMNTSACYFCEFKPVCSQPPEFRQHYLRNGWSRKPGWNPLANR